MTLKSSVKKGRGRPPLVKVPIQENASSSKANFASSIDIMHFGQVEPETHSSRARVKAKDPRVEKLFNQRACYSQSPSRSKQRLKNIVPLAAEDRSSSQPCIRSSQQPICSKQLSINKTKNVKNPSASQLDQNLLSSGSSTSNC